MVPSVKVLALKVRFGIRKEAKTLPAFLRCFPNVETLHVLVRFHTAPILIQQFCYLWHDKC